MSKRNYTRIQEFESAIIEMREAGKTRQEIADQLGLKKEQIKGWIKRYNSRQARMAVGIIPKPKGRPPKGEKSELERLRMENKLLRDFLQLTERM